MGFLNENDSFGLFINFGRIVVRSVFDYGLFKTSDFLSILVGFFGGWGAEGIYLVTPFCLSWFKKAKLWKRKFFCFLL